MNPILVLQMQRMGDLILSFQLIVDLFKLFPKTPIWVVAEDIFFLPLLPLAPSVTFFSTQHLPQLAKTAFSYIINISTRKEAAAFMATATAEQKLGAETNGNRTTIHGFWQLYRHSLTQNNRHNTLHWADLNRLDFFPTTKAVPCRGYTIRKIPPGRHIACVLGASQEYKHPPVEFWSMLARGLLKDGYRPFFVGGKAEKEMGRQVAAAIGVPEATLCGKLALQDVASLLKNCTLCITPDTGPMHLADWLGVPVLNLSMGSVRAHETGPYATNQCILAPAMSCVGCWECKGRGFACKTRFRAASVLRFVRTLLSSDQRSEIKGLMLYHSDRQENLYILRSADTKQNIQRLLDDFWRSVFFALYDKERWNNMTFAKGVLQQIAATNEHFYRHFFAQTKKLLDSAHLGEKKSTSGNLVLFRSLEEISPSIRLLAGFLDMFLQNAGYEQKTWRTVSTWLDQCMELFTP